jgi:hypothetical protein
MGLYPQFTDIMTLPPPADLVNKAAFTSITGSGHPKRAVLVKYTLFRLEEAAKLLTRLETSSKFATSLFVNKPKITSFVNELRQFLGYFGLLPPQPEGWVDRYPLQPWTDRVERSERIAQTLIDGAARGIRLLEANKAKYERALAEFRDANVEDAARHALIDRFLQARDINDPEAFAHMGRRSVKRSWSGRSLGRGCGAVVSCRAPSSPFPSRLRICPPRIHRTRTLQLTHWNSIHHLARN